MSDGLQARSSGRGPGRGRGAWLPAVLLAASALYVASALRPTGGWHGYRLPDFARLPVVDQGRVKPIDTLARTSLMILSNKQTMWIGGEEGTSDRDDVDGHEKVPAVRWLLDVMARPDRARRYTVIRIDHPDVLSLIHAGTDRKYFSFDEVMQHRDVLSAQIERAQGLPSGSLTRFQRSVLRLSQQLGLYFQLEDTVNLYIVPPESEGGEWLTMAGAQQRFQLEGKTFPALESFIAALTAWHNEDAGAFNAAVADHLGAAGRTLLPGVMTRVGFEAYFNHAAPLVRAMGLYVLVFILALVSWLRLSRPLARAAFWVLVLTVGLHSLGLIARSLIQGRPPVTNLYSSAVFVGWGAAVLGAVLERLWRNGIGSVTASVMGFLTLLVAHNLSLDGDTMTMMQAVLDTNFWLATHVVVITLGYSSTFLAGFLGILYVVRGVFTRSLTPEVAKSLNRMIYGIICFAALFCFVGTILGGIWADQSWGRFWGWDPKENGALLIVLWNALVLHARWGGMARQRGLALLAIGGNIVTAWSWFGTNMLGVGLHAYGFIDSAVFWMLVFVASQLALIGVGMLPLERWRSRMRPPAAAARRASGEEAPLPEATS